MGFELFSEKMELKKASAKGTAFKTREQDF